MKNDELTKLIIDAASNLDVASDRLTEIKNNLKIHCCTIEEAEIMAESTINKLLESATDNRK